jgi:hypothetical protein
MNKTSSESLQQTVKTDPPSGIARRRLLRAGLAAPVVLAVSGRSAMAGDCAKGLSPLAWNSLAPDGTNCYKTSHTVNPRTPGTSLDVWKERAKDDKNANPGLYHDLLMTNFMSIFNTSGINDTMKRILKFDSPGTNSFNSYFCAAYFNTVQDSINYAISLSDLQDMYNNRRLLKTNPNNSLTDQKIMDYLAQTW